MEIIQNSELRKLCTFGTKFRENPPLNVDHIRSQLKDEVGSLAVKICQKYRKSRVSMKKWKACLFRNLVAKLMSCKERVKYSGSVLNKEKCKRELTRLQDRYVITVVDKAAGNFAFTCKKFYFLRLAKELIMNYQISGNDTYTHLDSTKEQLVRNAQLHIV